MPFPTATSERPRAPKKGKAKSRRYGIAWVYREEPSNDDNYLHRSETTSTNVQSAITSLLRSLNADVEPDDEEFLRKSSVVIIEVRLLGRGETYAAPSDEEDEDE
jgi:hypothetical protein